jgi:hypothetical protein
MPFFCQLLSIAINAMPDVMPPMQQGRLYRFAFSSQ